jgi:hypothetical protein
LAHRVHGAGTNDVERARSEQVVLQMERRGRFRYLVLDLD